MDGYKVTLKETSKELTARERILMRDTTNAVKLDEAAGAESPLIITPAAYAILGIHNDKSDNKDYDNYIIVDTDGNKYVTGSTSFWSAFKEIWDEMLSEEEEFQIEVYKLESKNYKGKHFITCSIV